MARRGENIYERKDGRWEGRYIKGRKPNGKPLYGSVYARKLKECKRKLTCAKALYINGGRAAKTYGTGTVTDFVTYWLYGIARLRVKPSTFSNYATILEKWVNPFLGNMKLCKVTKEDVQRFVNVMAEHELSAGTVRNIYRVLCAAMKKACEYNYIHINPCEKVSLPEIEKKEARILTVQEQKALEQTARANQNGFSILLAMYTGLRVGEICGLKWIDVDLDNGVIQISRTIQRIKVFETDTGNKTVLIAGKGKSRHSSRTIPLPSCIVKLFREQKRVSDYVFTCRNHPLEPRILQYRFKALLKKAGLDDMNFHALRHTFATRCMEMCFDVKTLSEILGHASAKMTLDRYSHSLMEHKRVAMQSLDQLFERSA